MIAQWQIRVGRPVAELLHHADALQARLQALFHTEPRRAAGESDIDWEDGEPHPERDAGPARH